MGGQTAIERLTRAIAPFLARCRAWRGKRLGAAGSDVSMSEEALPGTTRANTHSERFRDAMELTRSRTDLTSKGLAGVGTAAVAALGYAKLADVFPYGGPDWALATLIAGVLGMALAVGLLVRRFFSASQVVITSPDLSATAEQNDLDKEERQLLKDAYTDSAMANDAKSLQALADSGRKLEEEALAEQDPGKSKAGHRQAERIFAEVQAAQDRGAAFIVRRRATYALFGWRSLLLLLLFVVGWYGTALGADALENQRKDGIDVATLCAEARAKPKIVETQLPGICGELEESGKEEPSAGKVAADAVTALATARAACVQTDEQAGKASRACAGLNRALKAAVEP